jgi:hypothetical protein
MKMYKTEREKKCEVEDLRNAREITLPLVVESLINKGTLTFNPQ